MIEGAIYIFLTALTLATLLNTSKIAFFILKFRKTKKKHQHYFLKSQLRTLCIIALIITAFLSYYRFGYLLEDEEGIITSQATHFLSVKYGEPRYFSPYATSVLIKTDRKEPKVYYDWNNKEGFLTYSKASHLNYSFEDHPN